MTFNLLAFVIVAVVAAVMFFGANLILVQIDERYHPSYRVQALACAVAYAFAGAATATASVLAGVL